MDVFVVFFIFFFCFVDGWLIMPTPGPTTHPRTRSPHTTHHPRSHTRPPPRTQAQTDATPMDRPPFDFSLPLERARIRDLEQGRQEVGYS